MPWEKKTHGRIMLGVGSMIYWMMGAVHPTQILEKLSLCLVLRGKKIDVTGGEIYIDREIYWKLLRE